MRGMVESFLLSEEKPTTPDVDGLMALSIFRRRAQNKKIGKKWTSKFRRGDLLSVP